MIYKAIQVIMLYGFTLKNLVFLLRIDVNGSFGNFR